MTHSASIHARLLHIVEILRHYAILGQTPLGQPHPPMGMQYVIAATSPARSTPVCPPLMILQGRLLRLFFMTRNIPSLLGVGIDELLPEMHDSILLVHLWANPGTRNPPASPASLFQNSVPFHDVKNTFVVVSHTREKIWRWIAIIGAANKQDALGPSFP